ncbi:2-aminoethylphosphonate-pyruvate transaminase/2-aminoethylphosphonate-pyruvate transaminase [Selenomonas ruminantium]|uniref:2-aminoethylphosphonate--pyruvate transaminase n=1 Tax=Selenomonas ruminantium TaxID=971 RepID=A0A1M6ULD0_SELRU|nr:2-aminoethylphosphonate aminotransferase [Selenomonas ruminantium]SHK70034.1 2-aminoethylphosphonate-pyruvate transaminase/2-aminoethylphosphonate-pyruvate transaminase [Selenomonas ruminantium]
MKRNILLNPGPATTTDTVKQAQVVPDICPREQEFGQIMADISHDLLKIVHADPKEYSAVLFCGSGTLCMDVCVNSLVPQGKKILFVNNGAYSSRAVDIAKAYGLDYIDLNFPVDGLPDLAKVADVLERESDIAVVYTTHQETGTGILNPIREIGALAHNHGAVFIVDTTSTLAMLPIDIESENIDFCMASAQKGIQAMTGLSYVIGRTAIIEESRDYPVRSYYCNLYLQYDYFRKNGQMHFTPPVQTIYSVQQALKEYFAEGEQVKWQRHQAAMAEIHKGLQELGLREVIPLEIQSGLVAAVAYPDTPQWDFDRVHDYCYERGFTIYPGKMQNQGTFRLCVLGAITADDIKAFFAVFQQALRA